VKPMNAIDDFLMAMGSGLYQSSKAGLTGLANLPEGIDKAVKAMEESYDGYQPQTLEGQAAVHALGKVGEVVDKPFKWLGDKTLDITGSPAAAAAAYTIPQFLSMKGIASKATAPIGPSVKTSGLHKRQGGMYMGPSATSRKHGTSDLDNMVKKLTEGNATRGVVWNNTGNKYNKPAMVDQRNNVIHEISDRDSVMDLGSSNKELRETTLKDILNHPELYAEYPDLASIKVNINKGVAEGNGALGSVSNNLSNPSINLYRTGELPMDTAKNTLLHEVQHIIQGKENMPSGGGSNIWPDLDNGDALMNSFKLMGERQARDTGNSMDMSLHQRKMKPTWQRSDKDVGVRYDDAIDIPEWLHPLYYLKDAK